MTLLPNDSAPALLRSRSLMRGYFDHDHTAAATKAKSNACVVTHSSSILSLDSWGGEDNSWELVKENSEKENPDGSFLPPIIDDCTELDHSRRVDIASSHGFSYDETYGVQSILDSLTSHEKKYLADDNMPLRHYRAEKGNLKEAIRKIKTTLKWREEFGVEDIKRCFDHLRNDSNTSQRRDLSLEKEKELTHIANTIAHENETGKIYCRGYDKEGRAILYLTPGRENSTDEMNNMRHLVYHLERAIACTRKNSGREKVCIVIGYQGFKLVSCNSCFFLITLCYLCF